MGAEVDHFAAGRAQDQDQVGLDGKATVVHADGDVHCCLQGFAGLEVSFRHRAGLRTLGRSVSAHIEAAGAGHALVEAALAGAGFLVDGVMGGIRLERLVGGAVIGAVDRQGQDVPAP